MVFSCMIVDDDSFSRQVVKKYIEKTKFLELRYECSDAFEAVNILAEDVVDVVFLDIRMPEMTGLEFIKSNDVQAEVVLITSHEEHAIEAFELGVTDYLLKPLEYGRFLKAINKIRKKLNVEKKYIESQTDMYVKSDSKIVKITLKEIQFVEALADYVIIHTDKKRYIVHSTMKGILLKLPSYFSRVHRSYIVNTTKIQSMQDLHISIENKSVPIGASFKDSFLQKLNFL